MRRNSGAKVLHGTTRPGRRRYVQVRWIDEMLLEDVMLRSKVETTRTAARFQTAALLVVLLGVVTMLAHSVIYGDRTEVAAKGPHLERGHHTPLDERWFW
jgi:hypothetical protein